MLVKYAFPSNVLFVLDFSPLDVIGKKGRGCFGRRRRGAASSPLRLSLVESGNLCDPSGLQKLCDLKASLNFSGLDPLCAVSVILCRV